MSEHLSSAASEIAQAANVKASAIVANSTLATGVVITSSKPDIVTEVQIGAYLSTHGIGYLSYMEIISIVGAVYLTYQFSISVYDRFLSKKLRSNTNGQSPR